MGEDARPSTSESLPPDGLNSSMSPRRSDPSRTIGQSLVLAKPAASTCDSSTSRLSGLHNGGGPRQTAAPAGSSRWKSVV